MSDLPLHGRRIVVPRAPEQAAEWLERLRALGAEPILLPTIAIAPPADPAPLERALARLNGYDGIIFTSANAVRAFFGHAHRTGATLAQPTTWTCAVGPATASALQAEAGWDVQIVPADANAEGVIAALAGTPVRGRTILFPCAAGARDLIPMELTRRGAVVESVEAYRTVLPATSQARARSLFPGVDAVLFSSASTARNLAALLGSDYRVRLRETVLAALGPSTRRALEELGLTAAVEARQATLDSLILALREHWHARTS